MKPREVRCPRCGAMPGRPCGDNRSGMPADTHKAREQEAQRRQDQIDKKANERMRKRVLG